MEGVPPAAARTWRPGRPVALRATLAALRRGGGDPCFRAEGAARPDGADGVWRATRTPEGPALLGLRAVPAAGEIRAHAWGPGAERVLDGVPELLGERDDPTGFAPRPEHPLLQRAWTARPGWRVGRSRAVFEALVAAALEQRVTGREARDAWHRLVLEFGDPAPGPGGLPRDSGHPAAGMRVMPTPAVWRQVPQHAWLRAGVDVARRRVVLAAAEVAPRLEETVDLAPEEADRRLRALRGVGVWTSAEVRQRALGDADAFSWHDYHVAGHVSWALTGEVLDDAGCAAVIEPYRGHRYRVQRLLELQGIAPPRRGPRRAPPTHLPR